MGKRFCRVLITVLIVCPATWTRAASPETPAGKSSSDLLQRMGEVWLHSAGVEQPQKPLLQLEEMVPMQDGDGTKLATNLYYPLRLPPYPAIVIRTPYGKDSPSMLLFIGGLTASGYAVAIQDVRGRGKSEGENRAFLDDGWGLDPSGTHWDGYDTVQWVAGQSWCNGKVGIFGFSALGISANFAAGALPPALKCSAVQVAAADIYHDAAHLGGGFRKSLVEGWLGDIETIPEVLETIIEHEAYDSFWQEASVIAKHSEMTVPTYHIGGWYDIFLQGTLNHFSGLQISGATGARGNQRALIGPWTHGGMAQRQQGQLEYPTDSILSEDDIDNLLKWFNYWLKGEDEEVLDLAPFRYYLMGDVDDDLAPGNEWREAAAWPVPATAQALYFAPGGILQGTLPAAASPPDAFVYDPGDPVPTLGGANLELDAGPYDQALLESRSDVLVYTSPVLTEPLEITGRITVELYGASSAPDTDWTAKLCDVYPDGRSMLVTDGILRAKFRDSFESSTLMTPGEVYRFEIDLWSTALVFNTGHRIRIDLSSSNDPRFDPNPNTGEPLRQHTRVDSATNEVYFSPEHPSQLVLPVVSPANHPLFQPGKLKGPHFATY